MEVETEPKDTIRWERKPRGFNWKVMTVTFTVMFGSSLTITMVFPFLPWMVRIFKIDGEFVTVEETGYYVGLVATAYFLGRFIGSYFWGVMSDKKGRRPTVIISGVGITLFTLLFGFTNTTTGLPWALVTRFCSGAFNGVVAAVKAIVSDISDDTNQAKAMVVISSAFSVGMTVGPALGGALAEPVRQYSDSFQEGAIRNFLEEFPYFLPSFVISALSGIATMIAYCKLPETRIKHKYTVLEEEHSADSELSSASPLQSDGRHGDTQHAAKLVSVHYNVERDNVQFSSGAKVEHDQGDNDDMEETDNDSGINNDDHGLSQGSDQSLDISELKDSENVATGNGFLEPTAAAVIRDMLSVAPTGGLWTRVRKGSTSLRKSGVTALKTSRMWTMLKSSEVRKVVCLYSIFSFAVIGSDEIYSLWLSTQPDKGGLGFSERNIGISLAVLSTIMLISQLLFVSKLEQKIGSLELFYIGCIIIILAITLFPALASVTNDILLWTLLVALQGPFRLFVGSCMVMCALFINNSVERANVGAVNGLAVSATALTRAASPSISGSLFAWSIGNGAASIGFPLDEHFIFYLFGIVFFLSLCLCITIPEHVKRKKIM